MRPGSPPLTVNADAGTATNLSADKLDGKDSTEFVSAIDDKAADADKLDGKDSTDFAPAGTATAFTARNDAGKSLNPDPDFVVIVSKNVPAGSYAVNTKVSLSTMDDDDWGSANCQLMAGGRVVDHGTELLLGEVYDAQTQESVGHSEEYPLQAVITNFGGGEIAISCHTFSASSRVDATNAAITAIRVGSVQ